MDPDDEFESADTLGSAPADVEPLHNMAGIKEAVFLATVLWLC